jgi:iron complex transport system permease protein
LDRRQDNQAATVVLWATAAAVVILALVSLFTAVIDIDLGLLLTDPDGRHVFMISRIPRTLALILSGSAMAVAGLILQHLAQNRFIAPTTAGTVDAAAVGVLFSILLFPSAPVMAKVLIALLFALLGTAIFIGVVQRTRFRDPLLVPLLGLVLAGVYRAIAEFFAYRNNLTQSLDTWFNADFSGIIAGRYETLWLAGVAALSAYVFANRLTAAGMGEAFATNIGVSYRATMAAGLAIASLATAVVVVTVGAIPFLGLIVPNVVTLMLGDNLRRVLPITAMAGAALVLACDIVGRTVIFPYEIPVGTIVGVIGAGGFLVLVMRRGNRYASA